jgi:N-acetyl sugar amidotransferase
MNIKRRCKLGIWDETVSAITFDDEGVSNYAKIQQKLMETYPRGEQGQLDWENIVADAKRNLRGKYDCIVGVSGGVDSSYLLYLLKVIYGLEPLAVTLDNGWSTNIAVENIKKMTSKLGIDLETYVIDYEEIKDLMRSYMLAGLPWIDMPTDIAIKSVMYKYALKENVKYIFRGNDFRSEGKQPRAWTYGDGKQLKYIHRKFGKIRKLKTYPYLPYRKIIYAGFIRGIKDIRPYYYIDYAKEEAKKFLEQQFDWQYYGGHHHENSFTKYAMSVWLPDKFDIDKRIINLSAQVLAGTLNRDSAINQISIPALDPKQKEDLCNYILKKLDFQKDEYDQLWNSPNKSYKDYPNYEKLLYFILKFLKPFIKLVYRQTPMTFIEMEINNSPKRF